jgi:hypothetical protein
MPRFRIQEGCRWIKGYHEKYQLAFGYGAGKGAATDVDVASILGFSKMTLSPPIMA